MAMRFNTGQPTIEARPKKTRQGKGHIQSTLLHHVTKQERGTVPRQIEL